MSKKKEVRVVEGEGKELNLDLTSGSVSVSSPTKPLFVPLLERIRKCQSNPNVITQATAEVIEGYVLECLKGFQKSFAWDKHYSGEEIEERLKRFFGEVK